MKYTEKEWLEIVSKNQLENGEISILGINLDKNLAIESVEIRTDYDTPFCSWGRLEPNALRGFCTEGKRYFVKESDGSISLCIGENDHDNKVCINKKKLNNPKVIPFEKWAKDYFKLHKLKHSDVHDKYYGHECIGCELNQYGFIRNVRFIVDTYYKDKKEEGIYPSDILILTYGMCRNDVCDEWHPGATTTEDSRKCYFDESFNLIFDDDEGYSINEWYFSNEKGVKFSHLS